MREKLIIKYPEKNPKIFPPTDSCAKSQKLTSLQEPMTSASAVTCIDEIQQKNLKGLLI